MPHITIIGGGIAGLATAYYLQKKSRETSQPLDYTLIESSARFGGKIATAQVEGFVIEGGPDSFITQKPWAAQLCRELGLADTFIPTNDERRAIFVLQKGKLIPFPGGYRLTVPTEFIPFALSPLISPLGKLRMGLDLIIPPRREPGDESLADFIRRRLGTEALDRIAGPVMAGIYVADPERLSLLSTFPQFAEMEQKHGSLIKAMRAITKSPPLNRAGHNHSSSAPNSRHSGSQQSAVSGLSGSQPASMFTSLRGGMNSLVEALVGQLQGNLRLNSPVSHLRRLSAGFEIELAGASPQMFQTDAVVLAIPAYMAAALLDSIEPSLAAMLKQVRYLSTATVSLGYRQADITPQHSLNGFGFMVPKSENRQILACTWSSTKFDQRAPGGDGLLRVFVGGDGREHLVENLADKDLLTLVQAEIASIMGLTAQPVVQQIFRWPKGNPQYDVGHLDRVTEMEQRAAAIPGLYLTGSAFRGIGLPDCIKSALATVESLITNVERFSYAPTDAQPESHRNR